MIQYSILCKKLIWAIALVAMLFATPDAAAQTTSDACSYAVANQYTVNTSCTFETFNKPGTYNADYNPGTCGAGANDDAFGWFQATATSTTVTFDPLNNHDAVLHVFTGPCGGPYTQISCANAGGNGVNETVNLTTVIGTNYLIRTQRIASNNGMDGSICVYSPPPPPANDDPCAATVLTVNTSCSNTASTNIGATSTGGIPAPTCASYSGGDVWFSFVAPVNGVANIETTAGGLTDSGMELYTATACNGTFTSIECDNNDGSGNMSEILRTGLTSGQTYYIRLWGASGAAGTFSICVWATPPPANDDPCGATALTVNTTCSTTPGTNVGAISTTGVPAPTCANYSGGDVWYSFVAPTSGMANISTTANGLTDTGLELYSATACNGTFTSIECDDDDGSGNMSSINRTGLTPGQTYYVRVWGYGGARGTFGICVVDITPPANDEPCAATALTLGTTCSSTNHTNVNGTLTGSIPDPGCGGYSGSARDVWFSFTAPSTGTAHFEVTAGTLTNLSMALYTAATCNGTFFLIECDDNDGPANTPFLYLYDLVPGDTYYLRVWGNGGTSGTFDLCAVTPPTTGSCFYALHLNDSGGDGWGGSTVGVSINGGGYTNYTLSTGNRAMIYLPLNFGDIIVLNYTAVGGFQNEISYILQSGNGVLFSDGPTPAAGVVYGHTNDCVAPDPPRDDCYGSLPVCGAASVSSNPGNTGLKPDLNLHNRGCLSNDERQGTWFNFGISASGTLEFTVVPSNGSDDYDFALWGPETSVVCPPSEVPYRCSYSGATGNTGLLLGSGDDTEDSSGDKFVNEMTVTVGEVYVLYVSNWSQSGLAFDLTWNPTNGASIDCTVLPIELLSFRADALTTSVALDWVTASESGNSHFVVERSIDGEHFAPIGQVQGAGDSYTTLEYAFMDPQPTRGINYYRLKQVDVDGTFSYSNVEAVSFGLSISVGTPFPNPATGSVHVEADVTIAGDAELQMHDASGRLVRSQSVVMSTGKQLLTTSIDGLDPGTYVLTVNAPDGTTTRAGRFVVQ